MGLTDCQYSNARKKIGVYLIMNVSTTKKLLIDTLVEEMENVVLIDK